MTRSSKFWLLRVCFLCLKDQKSIDLTLYCTARQMIPDCKWSPERKWFPNWTPTDPKSQMIPAGKRGGIGHVRYINILTWLRGFQVKTLYLVVFSLYLSLFWELRDKGNLKNLQFWPESLEAMLEYWYIVRLLAPRGGKMRDPGNEAGTVEDWEVTSRVC